MEPAAQCGRSHYVVPGWHAIDDQLNGVNGQESQANDI
jgi:hypothetical protein